MTVAALTVTYADRFHYLQQALQRLRQESQVACAVVVDNGTSYALGARLAQAGLGSFVHVLSMGKNQGSALGYDRALRYAMGLPQITHAYLLDDDNLPEPGAVDTLAQLAADRPADTAFVSYRPSRPEQRRLVEQGIPVAMQAVDSFIGFSLRARLKTRLRPRPAPQPPQRNDLTAIDYAPYGGFFLALERLAIVGFPRTEYLLYADDHEFTHRFVSSGGSILLCQQSRLQDLEPSWHGTQHRRIPGIFDPDNADFRVFYSTRNRVALERELLVRSPAAYWTNAALSLGWSLIRARAAGVPSRELIRRSKLLRAALEAGWKGELGPSAERPMPGG
jgi:GT2 family glycosyltransferase